MKNLQCLIGLAVFATALIGFTFHDQAAALDSSKFLITADEVDYDREKSVVVASGNVEIIYGDRTLLADRLSYDQHTDTVTATGNIVLLEPTGEVVFSEYVELADEMKNGVIEQIRLLLTDDSRLAAVSGRRIDGYRTEMVKAVFSPCKICREHPNRPPLWRLRAQEVVHDSKKQSISYRNAFLEMFGVPVAYTPYLSHPGPTVKRKTGLLVPDFGSTSGSGKFLQIPYFWAMSVDKDVTFKPIFTNDELVMPTVEYRQRFDTGELKLSGALAVSNRQSGTIESLKQEGTEIRGHLLSKGRFDHNDTWRWGFDVERASDRTYFKRFPYFGNFGNTLVTSAFSEGFHGRSYAATNAYLFQDLRTNDSLAEPPLILPMFDFNHVGEPNDLGGRWSLDTNTRVLFQNGGTDSQRISLKPGYSIPLYANAGHVTTLQATMQADLYNVKSKSNSLESGITGRIFPQGSVDWRYPFYRQSGAFLQLIEPVIGVVVAPNGSNPENIPNEESNIINLDETNLVSTDRIPGLDRIESGQRVYYGLRSELHGDESGLITMFVGQSYRHHVDEELFNTFGIEKHFSDYVGRIDLVPNDEFGVRYRFRLDKDDLAILRNELGLNVTTGPINFSGDYLFIDSKAGTTDGIDSEELRARITSSINDDWRVSANTIRDLNREESRSNQISLVYEDLCFRLNATFSRAYTTVAEIGRSDKLFFRLTFKNLGEIQI